MFSAKIPIVKKASPRRIRLVEVSRSIEIAVEIEIEENR